MTSMSKCQIVPTAKRPKMLFIPRKQSSGCDMILPDFRGESPPFIYESPPTPYGSDSDDEEIFDWPETLIGESQLNWSSSSAIPVCFKFTDKPEFLGEQVDNPSSPVSYFRLIFNSELSCELVKQINKNKPKNVTNKLWPRTNEQEVNEFISILMQMSILQTNSPNSYWWKNQVEMKLLLKPNLTFERFRQLCESLEDDDKSTFCGSLKSFYSLLQYRLRSIYAPARNLSVSEIQFRSASSQQSSFPLLNDMTRADGVQLFQLHDSRGFVLDFHLESRAILNRKDSRAKVVKKLIKSRLDVGHAIYLNSSFCSVALAHSLALRQTYLNGTFTPSQCDNLPLETFDLRTDSMAVQSEGVFIAKSAKSHLCTISTEFASDCFEKYKNGLKSIYPQDFVHCENESFNHDFYLDLRVFTHFLKIISQNAYVLYKFDTPPSSMLFQSFQSDIFKKLPL